MVPTIIIILIIIKYILIYINNKKTIIRAPWQNQNVSENCSEQLESMYLKTIQNKSMLPQNQLHCISSNMHFAFQAF